MKNIPWKSICSVAFTVAASVVSTIVAQYNQNKATKETGEAIGKVILDEINKSNNGKF